jgi:hypothetical protein
MLTSTFRNLLTLGVIAAAVLLALQARADDEQSSQLTLVQLPTGQYTTPLAPPGAVQQFLNPGLPAYPDFIAGEAVRAQLSPDGTTLAILCAGQNSLYKPDGTLEPTVAQHSLVAFSTIALNTGWTSFGEPLIT